MKHNNNKLHILIMLIFTIFACIYMASKTEAYTNEQRESIHDSFVNRAEKEAWDIEAFILYKRACGFLVSMECKTNAQRLALKLAKKYYVSNNYGAKAMYVKYKEEAGTFGVGYELAEWIDDKEKEKGLTNKLSLTTKQSPSEPARAI